VLAAAPQDVAEAPKDAVEAMDLDAAPQAAVVLVAAAPAAHMEPHRAVPMAHAVLEVFMALAAIAAQAILLTVMEATDLLTRMEDTLMEVDIRLPLDPPSDRELPASAILAATSQVASGAMAPTSATSEPVSATWEVALLDLAALVVTDGERRQERTRD
jgi:hypothetical protein